MCGEKLRLKVDLPENGKNNWFSINKNTFIQAWPKKNLDGPFLSYQAKRLKEPSRQKTYKKITGQLKTNIRILLGNVDPNAGKNLN